MTDHLLPDKLDRRREGSLLNAMLSGSPSILAHVRNDAARCNTTTQPRRFERTTSLKRASELDDLPSLVPPQLLKKETADAFFAARRAVMAEAERTAERHNSDTTKNDTAKFGSVAAPPAAESLSGLIQKCDLPELDAVTALESLRCNCATAVNYTAAPDPALNPFLPRLHADIQGKTYQNFANSLNEMRKSLVASSPLGMQESCGVARAGASPGPQVCYYCGAKKGPRESVLACANWKNVTCRKIVCARCCFRCSLRYPRKEMDFDHAWLCPECSPKGKSQGSRSTSS